MAVINTRAWHRQEPGKHTPGPWEVDRFKAGPDDVEQIVWPDQPKQVWYVAEVAPGVPGGIYTRHANARLISAAPEMLEILKGVDRIGSVTLDIHDLITAVVKKATTG